MTNEQKPPEKSSSGKKSLPFPLKKAQPFRFNPQAFKKIRMPGAGHRG